MQKILLFDAREIELIEKSARYQKISAVDYIRQCILLEQVLSGNFGALKIVSNRIKILLFERVKKIFPVSDSEIAKEVLEEDIKNG